MPWMYPGTHTPTLTLLLQPLLCMQCQFILLLSQAADPQWSKSHQQGWVTKFRTAFPISPSQREKTVSRHLVSHFTELPKQSDQWSWKDSSTCACRIPSLTSSTLTQVQTQLKATELGLTCAGMDVKCNYKLHHTINQQLLVLKYKYLILLPFLNLLSLFPIL